MVKCVRTLIQEIEFRSYNDLNQKQNRNNYTYTIEYMYVFI